MICRVTVWLDRFTPKGGGFVQGLEWAARLHCPLHGILVRETRPGRDRTSPVRDEDVLKICSDQCQRLGVPWQATVWEESPTVAAIELIRPHELCVFSYAVSPVLWEVLLHWTLNRQETISLVCPETSTRLNRVLIVNEVGDTESQFLMKAAQFCQALGASPVVLTAARQEREARRRECLAEEVFARQGLAADFDLIATTDIRHAVLLAARCRECAHVFVERQQAVPWWRWLRVQTLQRLLEVSEPLSFLTYSGKNLLLQKEPPEPGASEQRAVRAQGGLKS